MEARKKAGTIATLASAIVHAANMGAKVINISVTSCVSAADPLDQSAIGAAVWYAATVKDAVIVAAAGNDSEDECAQNPTLRPVGHRPIRATGIKSKPCRRRHGSPTTCCRWAPSTTPVHRSARAWPARGWPPRRPASGSWDCHRRPGSRSMPIRRSEPGEKNMPFWGTSFSAAYVSGVAALVRAKYPELSAHQIINRILQTAHNPPRGVDNQVGYGVVDPVAALTFNVPAGRPACPRRAEPGDRACRRRRHRRITAPAPWRWYSRAWSLAAVVIAIARSHGRGGSDDGRDQADDHRRRLRRRPGRLGVRRISSVPQ